jgi:phosphatidylglycerophosphatase A
VTRRIALLLATAGPAGYAPFAPGTFGSLVGLALWRVLPPSAFAQTVAIAVLFALGSWSGSVAEQHFRRTDPSYVVIDEVLGMVITLSLVPTGWPGAFLGFLLFRAADIVKPFPANRLERLPGGTGIMADDAMAGIYANIALRLILALRGRLISS